MKSLPENLKFDTANLKFAMSRDQIFLKNCKKYISDTNKRTNMLWDQRRFQFFFRFYF